jgi:glycerophosphoryl diester phosphodiesterase
MGFNFRWQRLFLIAVIGVLSPMTTPPVTSQTAPADHGQIVIAHRGASGYLPEHTLAAKAMAYAQGADYLEQDVVLSKDGVPLVLHDIYLDAVTNVAQVFPTRARTDGRYYAIDFTLAEIKALRINERISLETGKAVYPGRFPVGRASFQIATLSDEIELVQGLNKSTGRNVGIYPELKRPAWHHRQGQDLGRAVVEVLARYGYDGPAERVFLQCFEAQELRRLRNDLLVKVPMIQLLDEDNWPDNEDFPGSSSRDRLRHIAAYAQGIGPAYSLIVQDRSATGTLRTSSLVADARACGLLVHVYTLRSDELPKFATSFQDLLSIIYSEIGVDGAFTDFPDMAVHFLRPAR